MTTALAENYRHCRRVVRQSGSNFALAFRLLPGDKHRAMDALYAFARLTDDIGDQPGKLESRQDQLNAWQHDYDQALQGTTRHPVLAALCDTLQRFQIPPELPHEIITGVQFDLTHNRITTRQELDDYCYQVAGSVGAACLYIWGFEHRDALALAKTCGEAFQLTNILRDLREDAQRDRIYLPLEELAQFDYSEGELLRGEANERFDQLMKFELERAARLYAAAKPLERLLTKDGRPVFRLMFARYRAILAKIESAPRVALSRRVSLSLPHKLAIAARELWRRN